MLLMQNMFVHGSASTSLAAAEATTPAPQTNRMPVRAWRQPAWHREECWPMSVGLTG